MKTGSYVVAFLPWISGFAAVLARNEQWSQHPLIPSIMYWFRMIFYYLRAMLNAVRRLGVGYADKTGNSEEGVRKDSDHASHAHTVVLTKLPSCCWY